MPLYYFVLKNGRQTIPDVEGEDMPDEAAARNHAVAVARDLMAHREWPTGFWRIQVCDDYLQPRFEVLFASVDETMAHMPSEVRESHEIVSRSKADLADALTNVHQSLMEVRATLLLADRLIASDRPKPAEQP